jgi:hypothetical protein
VVNRKNKLRKHSRNNKHCKDINTPGGAIALLITKGTNFRGVIILPVALGPGVYSASNRNEYQKHKNNVSGE